MKRLSLILMMCLSAYLSFSQVHVNGYYKKNGTYVEPHYRSAPNSTKSDNWSTVGNINPYTGKEGTLNPYNYGNNSMSNTNFSPNGTNDILKGYSYSNIDGNEMMTPIYSPGGLVVPSVNSNNGMMQFFNQQIGKLLVPHGKSASREYKKLRYNIGREDAKRDFTPKKYSFWVPLATSAVFFPTGIMTSGIICDVQSKKNIVEKDKYYTKGYKRQVRKMIFQKSMKGFAIGATINVIAIFILVLR